MGGDAMAYVPKRLFIGRCRRCGKPIYKGDDYLACNRCSIIICLTCNQKLRDRCPACGGPLTQV